FLTHRCRLRPVLGSWNVDERRARIRREWMGPLRYVRDRCPAGRSGGSGGRRPAHLPLRARLLLALARASHGRVSIAGGRTGYVRTPGTKRSFRWRARSGSRTATPRDQDSTTANSKQRRTLPRANVG